MTLPRLSTVPPSEYRDLLITGFGWRGLLYAFLHALIRRPRAYQDGDRVVVDHRYTDDVRLLAHEYGHWKGHPHPSWYRPDMWLLDVMGYGFRVRDPHDLIPQTEAWLDEVEGDE